MCKEKETINGAPVQVEGYRSRYISCETVSYYFRKCDDCTLPHHWQTLTCSLLMHSSLNMKGRMYRLRATRQWIISPCSLVTTSCSTSQSRQTSTHGKELLQCRYYLLSLVKHFSKLQNISYVIQSTTVFVIEFCRCQVNPSTITGDQ